MAGEVNIPPRFGAGLHASRIWTMCGNDVTVPETDVGQESFVPFEQDTLNQRRPQESPPVRF